jgi:hypothetical protein
MRKPKTQVISVRVEPKIKAALQRAADKEERSQTNMIVVMVKEYCKAIGVQVDGDPEPASSAAKPRGTQ